MTTTHDVQWFRHKQDWQVCQRCVLGSLCHNHILGRGQPNARWLFLGLAPSLPDDEDASPFSRAEGRRVAKLAKQLDGRGVYYAHLLACRPADADGHTVSPSREQLEACWPRTVELLDLVQPSGVVVFGRVAEVQVSDELNRRGVRYVTVATPTSLVKSPTAMAEALSKVVTFVEEVNRESED